MEENTVLATMGGFVYGMLGSFCARGLGLESEWDGWSLASLETQPFAFTASLSRDPSSPWPAASACWVSPPLDLHLQGFGSGLVWAERGGRGSGWGWPARAAPALLLHLCDPCPAGALLPPRAHRLCSVRWFRP